MKRSGLCLMVLVGCGHSEIPYDLGAVSRGTSPQHSLVVAVLPLVDARDPEDRASDSDRFVYRRIEYVGTRLQDLDGDPMDRVTEVMARHLARRRVFAQLVLVRDVKMAPRADLVLSGRVRRLRGYVEADAPDAATGRPANERWVLSEVVLDELTLSPPKGPPRWVGDVGWSMHERRTMRPDDEAPVPWAIAAENLRVALNDLSKGLMSADLSGAFEVKESVHLSTESATSGTDLSDLAAVVPYGWTFTETPTTAAPAGWRAGGTVMASCRGARFEIQYIQRFHRVLGPYRPKVMLWSCSDEGRWRYNSREEFPAQLLGYRSGRWFFWAALGWTNWRTAPQEVVRYLGITPPKSKYVFEVGPGEMTERARRTFRQ